MTASRTKYRFVGGHVDDLHDGRPLVPGEFYELTEEEVADPHNAQRITDGLLMEIPPAKKRGASAATADDDGKETT
jgi:hypothetical protein